jgi:hypothetical protein
LDKLGLAEFELGLLYMPRGFLKLTTSNITTSLSQTAIQTPMILRFSILPLISIGVGGFLSYSLLSSANLAALDYGIVASFALRIGAPKTFSFLADLRYQFGMNNLSTVSGNSIYLRELQGLAGVVLPL